MIKTTGKEWKAFMNDDAFWKEWAIEEEEYIINEAVLSAEDSPDFDFNQLHDEDKVKVDHGYVYDSSRIGVISSLTVFFRKWRKAQTTETLVFTVPKDKVQAVKQAVSSALVS